TRVDEDDRGAMLEHELRDPIVDATELLVRRDRAELVIGDLDREIDLAPVSAIDDVGHRPSRPDEEARDPLDRLLRRRQADPDRRAPAGLRDQAIEALEGDREVRSALVTGDGVDLVDDHRAQPAEAG